MKIASYIVTLVLALQMQAKTMYDAGILKSDIHVISIGINAYSGKLQPLNLCVNDSDELIKKLLRDNGERKDLRDSNGNKIRNYPIGDIKVHKLNDDMATVANIRQAFKKVISEASYNDYFVFLFSGYSMESKDEKTYLVPYLKDYLFDVSFKNNKLVYDNYDASKLLSVVEVSKLMNQISCKKQLIISEAGNGTSFSHNLISELFESNPYIAEGTERNRIILTTKSIGREGGSCNNERLQNGYLMKYVLDNGNLLDVFSNLGRYEFWLTRSEMLCPSNDEKYIAIYEEAAYRDILLKNYAKSNSRGSKSESVEQTPDASSEDSKTIHAILVATTNYESATDWSSLKNPINDADAISRLLENQYGVKTHKLYNKTKEEILANIIALKSKFNEKDQLLFFIAGHGYFSNNFSDGYLVLKDSKALADDVTLESYLQMATLNRLLDNMAPNNVFAIFDVCFGASFDLNAKDVALSDYAGVDMDISTSEFVKRKNKATSRLFLASGAQEVPDFWNNSLEHSPFAKKVIKSLKQRSDFVSPGILFATLQGNATAPILKQFGKHEVNGEFLLQVN